MCFLEGKKMKGRRIDAVPGEVYVLRMEPGDYGKDLDGVWHCRPFWDAPPGCLAKHIVIEHEDGTITVSPSILIQCGEMSWHGHIKNGIWSEC